MRKLRSMDNKSASSDSLGASLSADFAHEDDTTQSESAAHTFDVDDGAGVSHVGSDGDGKNDRDEFVAYILKAQQSSDQQSGAEEETSYEEWNAAAAQVAATALAAEMADEMKNAAADAINVFLSFSDAMSNGGHQRLVGNSLGVFSPTNRSGRRRSSSTRSSRRSCCCSSCSISSRWRQPRPDQR